MTDIAISREQEIFVALEATQGTITPPAAGDFVIAAGPGEINQQPEYTDSPEVVNSRDILNRCQGQPKPGDWSFPVLCRPSGAAGTAPMEDKLLIGLFGESTVVGSTSVTYETAIQKPSYTLWLKKGHTVFHGSGATIGNAKMMLGSDCYFKYEFAGQFMRMGWAGTDLITAEYDAAGVLDVTDAKKFTVGARVQLVTADGLTTDDNTGAGFEVTAVDTTSETITITAAGTPATFTTGDTVEGWLPSGTIVGNPLKARTGTVYIEGLSLPTQNFEIEFKDDPKYLDDEVTDSGYTEAFVEAAREIGITLALYFREDDLKYFYDALAGTQQEVEIIVGDTAGSIVTVNLPKTQLDSPIMTDADPTVSLDINGRALGTNGEDAITSEFT